MNTTGTLLISEKSATPVRGWVLYDGECPLCVKTVAQFAPLLKHHHFVLVPLQTPWVQNRLGLKPGDPLVEMKLLLPNARVYGGADALVEIVRMIWWAWSLFALARIPGAMSLLRWGYRRIAGNRYCLSNVCRMKSKGHHHGATTFFEMP